MITAKILATNNYRVGAPEYVQPGMACSYVLSEEIGYEDGNKKTKYLYVSTSTVRGEVETYIFPADENGKILSWMEMEGSEQGTSSHEKVLENIGIVVVREEDQ